MLSEAVVIGKNLPEVWQLHVHEAFPLAPHWRCPCCAVPRSTSLFHEVVQLDFEITSFSSLSGTQPISWQVEYPRHGSSDPALAEIFICQKDLVAIVPLAMVRAPGSSASLAAVPAPAPAPAGRAPCPGTAPWATPHWAQHTAPAGWPWGQGGAGEGWDAQTWGMLTGEGCSEERDGDAHGMLRGEGWSEEGDGQRDGMLSGKGCPDVRDAQRDGMPRCEGYSDLRDAKI